MPIRLWQTITVMAEEDLVTMADSAQKYMCISQTWVFGLLHRITDTIVNNHTIYNGIRRKLYCIFRNDYIFF